MDPPHKLDVLWHNCDPFGMNGTQICILKESYQICFTCFLQPHHGRSLNLHLCVGLSQNLIHQPLEWTFSNEQFCALLVSLYFPQCNSSRVIPSFLSWWIYWWLSWSLFSNRWSSCLYCSIGRSISAFSGSLLSSHYNWPKFCVRELYSCSVCVFVWESWKAALLSGSSLSWLANNNWAGDLYHLSIILGSCFQVNPTQWQRSHLVSRLIKLRVTQRHFPCLS